MPTPSKLEELMRRIDPRACLAHRAPVQTFLLVQPVHVNDIVGLRCICLKIPRSGVRVVNNIQPERRHATFHSLSLKKPNLLEWPCRNLHDRHTAQRGYWRQCPIQDPSFGDWRGLEPAAQNHPHWRKLLHATTSVASATLV
jgi:hypothetical protein